MVQKEVERPDGAGAMAHDGDVRDAQVAQEGDEDFCVGLEPTAFKLSEETFTGPDLARFQCFFQAERGS